MSQRAPHLPPTGLEKIPTTDELLRMLTAFEAAGSLCDSLAACIRDVALPLAEQRDWLEYALDAQRRDYASQRKGYTDLFRDERPAIEALLRRAETAEAELQTMKVTLATLKATLAAVTTGETP